MTTYAIPPSPCPRCNHLYLGATSIHDDTDMLPLPPSIGDYTICGECEAILIFDREMHVRYPAPDEWRRLLSEPDMYATLLAMREIVHRWRKERDSNDITAEA